MITPGLKLAILEAWRSSQHRNANILCCRWSLLDQGGPE